MSLVIPAYNEAERLGPFLDEAIGYLQTELPGAWEVIVVDDGSADSTADVAGMRVSACPAVRLVRHATNLGKGAAVRSGVMASRGRFVLFADADGATPIQEERRLRRLLEAGADAAIGSREAMAVIGGPPGIDRADEPVQRDIRRHRYLIGRTFACIVNTILRLRYIDTQCGFKMFRRDVAEILFGRLTQSGYIFDVELLYLARQRSYCVAEVPVNWHDVPGSKVRLVRDSWRMLLAIVKIRLTHRSIGQADVNSLPRIQNL